MIRALNLLRSRLDMAFAAVDGRGWADGAAMSAALAEVRRLHDAAHSRAPAAGTIAAAVAAFRRTGELPRFTDLKYVCLGATEVDAAGDCLLASAARREQLLNAAERVPEPRRQLKCFQALLTSYWSFPLHGERTSAASRQGFAQLRDWLARRQRELELASMRRPAWFALLAMHLNLLGEQPCERYGPALLEGKGAALQLAIDDLAIPAASWVLEEAVLALMQAASQLDDAAFAARLPRLLALAKGESGLAVSRPLALRCTAHLLWRHARSASVGEQADLFDWALALFGSPGRHRPAWDAHVQDERGGADDLAREMVGSWLKQKLIRAFFQRLADEGASDNRRLAYWLRYEPFIADIWFVLAAADTAGGRSGEELRRHARGRLLQFSAGADRSLLVLRIGDYLCLEDADPGEAMRLLRHASLSQEQAGLFADSQAATPIAPGSFATLPCEVALAHHDGYGPAAKWERKFDEYLRPIVWGR